MKSLQRISFFSLSVLENIIRRKTFFWIKPILFFLGGVLYSGRNCKCSICNNSLRKFMTFGLYKGRCPKCGSFPRQRILWLYLRHKTNFFHDCQLRVLHIAPTYYEERRLRKLGRSFYISGDISSPHVMMKIDITHMDFNDNQFDYILCSHVLEHIDDDIKALKELFRVLKPNGSLLLQVPLNNHFAETREERRRWFFGQSDHLREYGKDFKKRVEQTGFVVKDYNYALELTNRIKEKHGLLDEIIFIATKPEKKK